MTGNAPLVREARRTTFDVICAGEVLWKAMGEGAAHGQPATHAALLDVGGTLARAGMRVGLATVLDDDRLGRAARAEIAALGIDVDGVKLASPAPRLFLVDAGGGELDLASERDEARELEVPPHWASQVLLLSGLSPVTSRVAALCRAARRARRDGTVVVLDVVTGLRPWMGQDPRKITMLLREVDVVRCSFFELAAVGIDWASVRAAMRPETTLVVHDLGAATATGPFGEVRVQGRRDDAGRPGAAEACTAAICAELARPRRDAVSDEGRWHRVLRGWARA